MLPFLPSEIYKMTPREISLKMEGFYDKLKADHEFTLFNTWSGEALARKKKLPSFVQYIRKMKGKNPEKEKEQKDWFLKEMKEGHGRL